MSTIKKAIVIIALFPLNAFSQDFVDNSFFRGRTSLFGDSLPAISKENPSLLNKKNNLKNNYLNFSLTSEPKSASIVSGSYNNLQSGQIGNKTSSLFNGAILTDAQLSMGFFHENFSFSPFINGDAGIKLTNPVFPEISGVVYAEYGGIFGYGRELNESFSVGGSVTVKQIKGHSISLNSVDLLSGRSGSSFSQISILPTLSSSYHPLNLNKTKFSASLTNIPLYKSDGPVDLDPLQFSIGLKSNILDFSENAPNIDVMIQKTFSSSEEYYSVGADWSLNKNISLFLGTKGMNPSSGLSLRLNPFKISIGTYSENFENVSQRVYSLGLRIY